MPQDFLQPLLSAHPVIAPFIFIAFRALAIIIPPIPGILIDVVGVALWKFFPGFIYAEIGIMLGAMTAFWTARKFRESLLERFIPIQSLHKLEKKLSENQKFWGLVVIRLPTNPFFDYISWIAGLTTITSTKFFFSTLIGSFPLTFVFYYIGRETLNFDFYLGLIAIIVFFIIWSVFKKMKDT